MATKIETGGGYQAGYDDGRTDGYNQGYNVGHLIIGGSIVDIPAGWKLVHYPSGNGVCAAGSKIPIVVACGGSYGTGSTNAACGAVVYAGSGNVTIWNVKLNTGNGAQVFVDNSINIYVPAYFSSLSDLLTITGVGSYGYAHWANVVWMLEKQ